MYDAPTLVLPIPRNRATEVPTSGYDDHTRLENGKSMKEMGYPVSLVFYNPTIRPKDVKALIRADLKEVEIQTSTPEAPALPKRYPTNKNAIVLLPRLPLKPKTTYSVVVECSIGGERCKTEWSLRLDAELTPNQSERL
jgi:hypothetical protein